MIFRLYMVKWVLLAVTPTLLLSAQISNTQTNPFLTLANTKFFQSPEEAGAKREFHYVKKTPEGIRLGCTGTVQGDETEVKSLFIEDIHGRREFDRLTPAKAIFKNADNQEEEQYIPISHYPLSCLKTIVKSGNCPPGATGPSGRVGPSGLPGFAGLDGRNGQNGVDGVNGDNGEPGDPGTDGVNGEAGTPGNAGAQGPKGEAGVDSTVNGADGVDGVDGDDGANGAAGAAGIPGEKGAKGQPPPPGSEGKKGEKGDKGVPGADGIDGLIGNDGEDGEDGWNGYEAKKAVAGLNGVCGPAGKCDCKKGEDFCSSSGAGRDLFGDTEDEDMGHRIAKAMGHDGSFARTYVEEDIL